MAQRTLNVTRANYGLDAPPVMQKYFIQGSMATIIGLVALSYRGSRKGILSAIASSVGAFWLLTGLGFIFSGAMMIWSSRVGKMYARDRLLDKLYLRGDETVLDVGCGRGVLLIGAAKRLPHGRALGIDLWSQEDLSDNSRDATLSNARAEGVADRVQVFDGDMRKLPFDDGSIDVVVASLSIHNIYSREGRREAINEIVRVLKRDGKVALMDLWHVDEYVEDLQAAGMQNVHMSGKSFWIFPYVRIATGNK
ncbi:MAG: class I SAM-dependent methyltransferase [Chloroflexota bacterium]|nr:class I SAM-dependent methyltransferase [Chloroflexota bacterium]